MPTPKNPTANKKEPATVALAPVILLIVLACAVGALCTWAFLSSNSGRTAARIPDYTGAVPVATTATPPDVSQLAPGPGAVALGNWNYDHDNWEAAITHYQKAISLGIDNADIRTDLGNAFRFSSHAPEALKQYAIAQQKNPRHENSLLNTASLHAEVLHDDAKAAELWREFLRRFPNSAALPQVKRSLSQLEALPSSP
ncbi:MAG: Tetratricopeptide repeat protein [Chthoniobacteraceae bacterium]|nr:Tetratricopeptide repeat protein [Chthoniobacteraceae bacterium]